MNENNEAEIGGRGMVTATAARNQQRVGQATLMTLSFVESVLPVRQRRERYKPMKESREDDGGAEEDERFAWASTGRKR